MVTIVTKGRFGQIDEILQYFTDEVKKLKGIGVAYVTTPSPLTEDQKKSVLQKLLDTTDFKSMEMHYAVDQSLIGGMQIRIGDRVVDSSVHTKIMKMQQELMKIQLGYLLASLELYSRHELHGLSDLSSTLYTTLTSFDVSHRRHRLSPSNPLLFELCIP